MPAAIKLFGMLNSLFNTIDPVRPAAPVTILNVINQALQNSYKPVMTTLFSCCELRILTKDWRKYKTSNAVASIFFLNF